MKTVITTLLILLVSTCVVNADRRNPDEHQKKSPRSFRELNDENRSATGIGFRFFNTNKTAHKSIRFESDYYFSRFFQLQEECANGIIDAQFEYLMQGIDWVNGVECIHYDWVINNDLIGGGQYILKTYCEKLIWEINYDEPLINGKPKYRHFKLCKELEILRYGVPENYSNFRKHVERQKSMD